MLYKSFDAKIMDDKQIHTSHVITCWSVISYKTLCEYYNRLGISRIMENVSLFVTIL